MKIIQTSVLLLTTLFVVPILSYFFGVNPGPLEWMALRTLFVIVCVVVAYSFIVGELTGNNSQVDKLWSIVPVIYVWVIAAYGDFSPRLILMSTLVTIWGIRLTLNFALKGAYHWRFWSGEEDYRWQVLRKKKEFSPRWKWTLFNLFFISGYQNILILLITLPAIIALPYKFVPLGLADYIVAGLMFFFITYETIADIQQWNFQAGKKMKIRAGEKLTGEFSKGFLDKGLWAYSRHPNYFAEQALWVCFYFFSVTAGGFWLNWTIAGSLLLMVLFLGSSGFSEEISAGKYPAYKDYQKTVPRFLPFKRIGSRLVKFVQS